MTQIIVVGASGRMGQSILRAAVLHDIDPVAAVVRPTSGAVGRNALSQVNHPEPLLMTGDLKSSLEAFPGGVVIDFATANSVDQRISIYKQFQNPVIIGVTGLDEMTQEKMRELSLGRAVLHSANTSLGANWLMHIVCETAKAFPKAQIDILDIHHKRKVDAPSGTAMRLKEAIEEGRGKPHPVVKDRDGAMRNGHDDVGISAIRAGNVIGVHEVYINLGNEVLTFKHQAEDRMLFAEGALRCAEFLSDKKPGMYTMRDVLGL